MSLENNCPDFEELSAWHDKESETDYTSHVAKCSDCQTALEDIKKIDNGLSDLLSSAQPREGFKEKLLSSAAQPPKNELRIVSHILKLAAVLAAAFALNYLTDQKDSPESNELTVKSTVAPKKHTVPVMLADSSEMTNIKPISDGLKTSIPEQDFQLVSMNEKTAVTEAVQINSTVKHVWLTEDPAAALVLIEKQMNSLNVLDKRKDKAGSYHLTIQMQEQELIKNVDWLAKQGFSLVSPAAPQPGTNILSKTPENTIIYNISVIKKQ